MEQKTILQYTGSVWSSEQKSGTSYRISLDPQKFRDLEPDGYGAIHLSISKRKEPNPKNKSTHNIYVNRNPSNYINDKYALLNLSLDKKLLLAQINDRGYCDIIALAVSAEGRLKDNARATHIVTNNLSKADRSDNSKRIAIGKAWTIYHKYEDLKPSMKNDNLPTEKLYVGYGFLKESLGVKYINVNLDQKLFRGLEPSNGNVYLNLTNKKDKENEFPVYLSKTKYDKWALYTIALDKEKTLSITPEKGYLSISLSNKKEESVGMDNANINVKANSFIRSYDPNDYPDGMNPHEHELEEKPQIENFFVGKGWTRENMYWLNERSEEIQQVQTLEKTKDMEGKGLTNKGLHIFQTVKSLNEDSSIDADTSNSYFLKNGLVYHEKSQNSILPKDGYPYNEFIKNYERLKEDYISSTFYNINILPEKEKGVFFENSPGCEEEDSKKKEIQDPDDYSSFSEALIDHTGDKKKEMIEILGANSTEELKQKKGIKI